MLVILKFVVRFFKQSILKDRTKHHNLKIQGHFYSLTVLFILNLDFFGFLSVLDLNSEILRVGGLTMLSYYTIYCYLHGQLQKFRIDV